MLRELQSKKLLDRKACKDYIGRAFRLKLVNFRPPWSTDEEVCDFLLE